MKKQFWVKIIPWNKETVTTALESGADAVVIPEGYTQATKRFGIIKTVAKDGDIKMGKDVVECDLNSKEDELKIAELLKTKIVIVKNWNVIALENLIAQSDKVFAEVKNAQEAELVIHIMEQGVAGVVLNVPKEK
jgi:3-dehydroquinate synthase II